MERRALRKMPAMLACIAIAACSKPAPVFPDTIQFARETLSKVTEWSRGGMSGVVYVPPGQTLPSASPQIGAIVSTEHATAAALHYWIDEQSLRSGAFRAHSSGSAEESCRAAFGGAGSEKRFYISLLVCRTGVARAACVEADEAIDQRLFERCLSNSACFEDICDERWLARREGLDDFVADILAKR